MKRTPLAAIACAAFATLMLASSPAQARHHWGNDSGYHSGMMWQQGGASQLTTEQQNAVRKAHDDYLNNTATLRQQLIAKRYEYNAQLASGKPDAAKVQALSKALSALGQALDEQRVQRDLALAQAGIPAGAGVGYGCGGSPRGGYGGMGHRMGW
ncbi:periplasmic heavy metal sensor [Entomohabitans teleogrylli]|uniref:periplasmic heavy metal sensor n=1 Tax=Entomohabitans teleogrylli TaxID=1384589 RepID=UPI00073D3500|nr:periplasmic heavy metal sensor [Entomohabitans teleogrylli]